MELIPGFGYGRNAKIFSENGMDVTGIEISETAIQLAKNHFNDDLKVFHGSVCAMPFDQEVYDGIYCYALLHLLNDNERSKLLDDCYNQLRENGIMVFIVVSKRDSKYGKGRGISKDRFELMPGVSLFFYDADSIDTEFAKYGLIAAEEMDEPIIRVGHIPSQKFWQVICKKEK